MSAALSVFAPHELIAVLFDGGVDYVLIGGLAVGAHGFPRATKDVDIVPAPDDANLNRLAGNCARSRRTTSTWVAPEEGLDVVRTMWVRPEKIGTR